MLNEKIINKDNSGFPQKKVLNFDEETYSVVSRPEYFPTQVKVPKTTIFEPISIDGHPYFVDEDNTLWSGAGASVYSKDLDNIESESVLFKNMKEVDENAQTVEWVCRTGRNNNDEYNIIVSITTESGNAGGRIYVSSDKGITWTKVLDAGDFGLKSLFRASNSWYHKVGRKEFIVIGSYGNNNAADESGNNAVWISKDLGLTWTKIYEPPLVKSGVNNHIHALCISPHNGWIWITHGDGNNRGIVYLHDGLYATSPTVTILSEGIFTKGGWQPSGVVTTINGAYFGTDTQSGLPNGILGYDIPSRTMIDKIGFKYECLHDNDYVHIARKGAQINNCEAYMPMHMAGRNESKIFVTGDAGFSWHEAVSYFFGPFEKGMTNPDKDGFVYGAGARFKVSEWENVTKWVKGRFTDKIDYV